MHLVHQVAIGEGSHPENVKVYGPGVEKSGLKANEPTYFTVDCSEAGQGEMIQITPGSRLCPHICLVMFILEKQLKSDMSTVYYLCITCR